MSMESLHLDLRKHLHSRIRKVIADHLDTCERMELPVGGSCAGVGDVLLSLTTTFFSDLEISPQEFAKMCLVSYRHAQSKRQQDET